MQQDELDRRCRICNGTGILTPGPPVRIDTLRNRTNATVALLELLIAQADELHAMAYERAGHRGETERVKGGSRDYALDNHGDPKARAALRSLNQVTIAMAEMATTASHDALRLLTEGHPPTTGPRTAQASELGEAIMAQARRILAGDFVPWRGMPQPGVDTALRAAEQDNARLTRQVAKLEKRVTKGATLAEQEAITEAKELRKQNDHLRDLLIRRATQHAS